MNFTHLVATFGYLAVLVCIAMQCTGIPFPGGALLIAAAVYAGTTHQLAVAPIILAAAVDAILGNLLCFLLGSREGIMFWSGMVASCPWMSTSSSWANTSF